MIRSWRNVICWSLAVLTVPCAVSLAVLPSANTSATPTTPPSTRQMWPGPFAAEYAYLDADGNGRVDVQELAYGQQRAQLIERLSWKTCDANGDGVITPREFRITTKAWNTAGYYNTGKPTTVAGVGSPPLKGLFQRIAHDRDYAGELATLREAVQNFEDDDAVVRYVIDHANRFPRLHPLVRMWVRPASLQRHVRSRAPLAKRLLSQPQPSPRTIGYPRSGHHHPAAPATNGFHAAQRKAPAAVTHKPRSVAPRGQAGNRSRHGGHGARPH